MFVLQLEYEKKMKIYENSPAYLAYLATKTKGKLKDCTHLRIKFKYMRLFTIILFQIQILFLAQVSDEKDSHDRSSSSGKQSAADRRIDIQPAEDEEGEYQTIFFNRATNFFDNI